MNSKLFHHNYILTGLLMLFCMPQNGNAEGFSVLVAPPRFELQANPGDTAPVVVMRDGERVELEVTFGAPR